MCELEKSSDNFSNDLSESMENRTQFLKHYNQLKGLSLLQNRGDMVNLSNLQKQSQKFLEHMSASKQSNIELKNLFHSVNNNNVILMNTDKDITRPDSTATNDNLPIIGYHRLSNEGGELHRRRERNFQVSDSIKS